jgi:transcriptional regulator with XRE-family HTH domain
MVQKTHGDDYVQFGKNIAEAREKMNLTQAEASKLLDIPQSTYAGYETGVRKVPLSIIKKLANFYKVSVDSLLDNEIEEDNEIHTLAAHHDGDEWTDEERQAIEDFKQYVLSKRDKK